MSEHEPNAYGHYSMMLEWDPNDRIYVVTVPELPGCQTHGTTLEEAIRQGRDAYESWIDVAREIGKPIPPPRHFVLDSLPEPVAEPVGVR
jgi:predicted RNase H-like HicB family nuclease